jgi:hypothetical protein
MSESSLPALRPMRVGELLDQAIRLYRKNFFTFVGIIALVYIPVSLLPVLSSVLMLDSLNTTTSSPYGPLADFSYWAGLLLSLFSSFLQVILVQCLGTSALTRAIADNFLGRPVGILDSYKRIGKSWTSVLGAYSLGVLILIGIVIWTIIPCIGWLSGLGLIFFFSACTLPLIAPVIVIEKSGAVAGLQRAWNLARRRFWWLVGYMLLLTLFSLVIVAGPGYLVNYLVTLVAGNTGSYVSTTILATVAQALTSILTGVIFVPMQLTAITLAYFDLRVRTEGFDLALLTAEASGETGIEAVLQVPALQEKVPVLTWEHVGYFVLLSIGGYAVYFLVYSIVFAALLGTAGF